MMIANLKKRLPPRASLNQVYSVIAFMVYGWTAFAFVWKLPSWLNYLNAGELLTVLAYSFSVNLLESLFYLGLLILICIVLPSSFLLDDFVARGTIIVLSLLGSGMIFYGRYTQLGQPLVTISLVWIIATLIILSALLILVKRLKFLEASVLWLADQLTVFLYIFLPLSALSIMVVMVRNIF